MDWSSNSKNTIGDQSQIAESVHKEYQSGFGLSRSPWTEKKNWQVRHGDQPWYPHVLWPLRWTIAHSTWMVPLLWQYGREVLHLFRCSTHTHVYISLYIYIYNPLCPAWILNTPSYTPEAKHASRIPLQIQESSLHGLQTPWCWSQRGCVGHDCQRKMTRELPRCIEWLLIAWGGMWILRSFFTEIIWNNTRNPLFWCH